MSGAQLLAQMRALTEQAIQLTANYQDLEYTLSNALTEQLQANRSDLQRCTQGFNQQWDTFVQSVEQLRNIEVSPSYSRGHDPYASATAEEQMFQEIWAAKDVLQRQYQQLVNQKIATNEAMIRALRSGLGI